MRKLDALLTGLIACLVPTESTLKTCPMAGRSSEVGIILALDVLDLC